jgi:hypothetical protein
VNVAAAAEGAVGLGQSQRTDDAVRGAAEHARTIERLQRAVRADVEAAGARVDARSALVGGDEPRAGRRGGAAALSGSSTGNGARAAAVSPNCGTAPGV